jgi:undecaprenyl diphosphate synthase
MNRLNHIAIIMDGNGRWGLKKKNSRDYGHLKGLKTVEAVIRAAVQKKIPFLTLYTFSTENWKRPKNEINFLFDLIRNSLKKNLDKLIKQGIKVNIIGQKKKLPRDILKTVKDIEKKTINNKKITLNLALNYGSKEEILNACKVLIKDKVKNINLKKFEQKLYTKNIPNPDILIRTGGLPRLSNFLLWQLAYTEIFFINKLWPDFKEKDLNNIINKFNKIKRNFGTI